MFEQYLVRVGLLGSVRRLSAVDGARYARGTRVVCRTERGLEVGQVLAVVAPADQRAEGQLLRALTPTDDLLLVRLQRYKDRAYRACAALLKKRGLAAVLMDVEHLFDGESLYFYFLGEVTPELESLTSELAEVYEAKVQFRRFAQTVAEGCGPGCGTQQAEHGCASGACATCAVACAVRAS